MKAKFVNEKIERGKKPFGLTSKDGQEALLNRLRDKGIYIWFGWDKDEEQVPKLAENWAHIEPFIELLHEVGVKYEDMELSHWDHVAVKTWQIMSGNHVVAHALTEKDAEFVMKVMESFCTMRGEWSTEQDGREHIHWSSDVWQKLNKDSPYIRDARPSEFEFVKNLEKNRKKYNIK